RPPRSTLVAYTTLFRSAMLTHRALLAHYNGTIPALDMTVRDNPLIAMPLYHSAALHIFIAPYLFLGATIRLLRVPDIPEILRFRSEEHTSELQSRFDLV